MAQKKEINPFDKFKMETKELNIKDFGKATIKRLTVGENDKLQNMLFNGELKDSKAVIDISRMSEQAKLKVSLSLVSPKMTVEQLDSLPKTATTAINEIIKAIDDWDKEDEGKN